MRVHRRGRRGQVARLIAASEALDEVPEPHRLVLANSVRAGHRAPCLDPDHVVARGARRQRIIGPSFPCGLPARPLETPGEHHRPTTRDVSVEEVSGSDGAHRDASHGMGRGAPRWRLPSVVVILAAVRISQTTTAAIISLLLEPSLAHRPGLLASAPADTTDGKTRLRAPVKLWRSLCGYSDSSETHSNGALAASVGPGYLARVCTLRGHPIGAELGSRFAKERRGEADQGGRGDRAG